eukprot:m.284643 g.284643  ORF g.284643 m.284643 type:complete len:197 (+) comp19911_c0_seq1:294-884(+)
MSGSEAGLAIGMLILGMIIGAAMVYYKLCPCLNNVIRFESKPFLDPMDNDDLKDQLINNTASAETHPLESPYLAFDAEHVKGGQGDSYMDVAYARNHAQHTYASTLPTQPADSADKSYLNVVAGDDDTDTFHSTYETQPNPIYAQAQFDDDRSGEATGGIHYAPVETESPYASARDLFAQNKEPVYTDIPPSSQRS